MNVVVADVGAVTEHVPEASVDGPALKKMIHECVNGPTPPVTVTVVEPDTVLTRMPDELWADPVTVVGPASADIGAVVSDFHAPPTPIHAPVTVFQEPPTPTEGV